MNIDQLKIFIKVAENSSFSIAAKKLNLSQSAVSKEIKELENYLNCTLFYRNTRNVKLTNSGIYFYSVAQKLLYSLQMAKNNLASRKRILTIGYSGTFFEIRFLPYLIKKLKKKYPNYNIKIQGLFLNEVINALVHNTVDVAFGEKDIFQENNNINFYPLMKSGYSIICNKTYIPFSKSSCSIKDLKQHKIYIGNTTRFLPLENNLHSELLSEIDHSAINYVSDMISMKIFILSEPAIGILPSYALTNLDSELNEYSLETTTKTIYGLGYEKDNSVISNNQGLLDFINECFISFNQN